MLLTSRYVIPVSSAFDTYIEYGAVLVEGDRIVEVGTAADLMARHPVEEVRDFGMAAIMPGFVDCHSHLEFSLMRGIPSLVLIFLLFMGLPQIAPALAKLPKSTFILVAMTLISSANLGEMMRSSYLAVEHGQTEAALSVGMTEAQALRRIILPQAIAIAVPNFGNNVISIFKETALAFSIGTLDLMGRAQTISQASFGATRLEVYISVAVIYWAICLILQLITSIVERATSRGRTVTA